MPAAAAGAPPASRSATVLRRTGETSISLRLALPGPAAGCGSPAPGEVATGCGFLDHLLAALARHGGFILAVQATGDDAATGAHHLAEDTGLALGEALRFCIYGQGEVPVGQAAQGVRRLGSAAVPMDEALTMAAVDLCGRPGAYLRGGMFAAPGTPVSAGPSPEVAIAGFAGRDWIAFCRGLANAGLLTLHLETLAGEDGHHILESAAKALGRALGEAAGPAPAGPTSTKGRVELAVDPWQ